MDRRLAIMISLILMSLTSLLLIVSNALPMWGKSGGSGATVTIGLWHSCVSILGQHVCSRFSCDNFEYGAAGFCIKVTFARSFMTVACISSAIGALVLFICLLQGTTPNPAYIRLSKGFPFGSLITAIVGTATGIAFVTYQSPFDVSAGAILAIIAIIVNICGAVMTVMIPINYY